MGLNVMQLMNLKHLFVKKYILKHLNFYNHRTRFSLYEFFFLPYTSLHMLNLRIL